MWRLWMKETPEITDLSNGDPAHTQQWPEGSISSERSALIRLNTQNTEVTMLCESHTYTK